uniref:Core domain-containing protein n=1 Tax=Fibrocapsa japonica TaxID=94617 RepID=A0A7S2XZD5_9STRA|mmetsp:Transcript_24155/g.35123  ORF Transcript_24155/g.35123 Transcript_24155/m.35123 type:complete len:164 (+) Transcript_24155:87-578(+)
MNTLTRPRQVNLISSPFLQLFSGRELQSIMNLNKGYISQQSLKFSAVGERMKRAMPPPIKITEKAAERIKELLSGQDDKIGIRLGVKRRGCNGLSYTMNYVDEAPKKDEEVQDHGVRVFVEPMALFHVVGTTMDFEETELSSEFTFKNPNAKGSCGCGESFNT